MWYSVSPPTGQMACFLSRLLRLRPKDLRAFRSDGSLGICLRVKVWHTVPICLAGAEIYQSTRGDQDYQAHSVEIDFDKEQGLAFEPDL